MSTETCDRCGLTDISVATFDGCPDCGPTPLCSECRAVHIQELLDEGSVTTVPEPPIGSVVHQTGTVHSWTRLNNGNWSCACDVNDCVQWHWQSVLDDIGSADYVIEEVS